MKDQGRTPAPPALRQIAYTSQRCFKIAETGWEWAIASLPLDFIIFVSRTPLYSDTIDEPLLVTLLLIAALGTLRDQIFSQLIKFRLLQGKIKTRHIKTLLFVIAGLATIEVIARIFAGPVGISTIITIVAIAFALYSMIKWMRQLKNLGERFLSDKLAQVEQANTLQLALVGGPLLAARAVGIFVATRAASWDITALGTIAALVLILALRPAHRDFMAACPRCKRMTSRVLVAEGCCPACSPERFSTNQPAQK